MDFLCLQKTSKKSKIFFNFNTVDCRSNQIKETPNQFVSSERRRMEKDRYYRIFRIARMFLLSYFHFNLSSGRFPEFLLLG